MPPKTVTYSNPVIPGFNPDPSVCRAGEDFYLVTSSFEYFPGVPLYHSRNLANWELVGYCLTRKSQLPLENCPASSGIYAPTIRHHDGVFYMTTTNTNLKPQGGRYGNFIVHTSNIRGEWSEPVYIDQQGIDPSLLFDGGRAWFCSNGGAHEGEKGIYLCEVNPQTGEKLSPSRLISAGTGAKCTEAPHIYHIGDYYYLLLAEGGTSFGHMVMVQRSRNIEGPYEDCPQNPVLSHRYLHRQPIQATGHADLFEDQNGAWWMVCLGIRLHGTIMRHNLGRETFLLPVRWEDGWPLPAGKAPGKDGTLGFKMEGPLPCPPEAQSLDIKADWTGLAPGGRLGLCWNYLRNPDFNRYETGSGGLLLRGGADGLSDLNPVFAAVRQQDHNIEAAARLCADIAAGPGGSVRAGITAYLSDSYHYEICLERQAAGLFLLVNRRVHDIEAVTCREPLNVPEGSDVELRIRSDISWYSFDWRFPGGPWHDCGRAMTAGLCSECQAAGGFTGVMLGVFCSGGQALFRVCSVISAPAAYPA